MPATVPTRYRWSARRVTFGRVSVDGGRPGMRPVTEGDDSGSDGFSFQTMTYSAGSTPYSGKAYGARRQRSVDDGDDRGDALQNMITKDQLASALKKSLTFVGPGPDDVGTGVEQQFSFGCDQLKESTHAHKSHDQASTPDFPTFKAFKTTSRRFVTPPSQSRRLLELHGKARRVSSADLSIDVDFASLKAAVLALKIDGLNVYGTVGQGDFLKRLGIETRLHALLQTNITEEQAEALYLAYHRLTDPDEMGTVYRAMSMVSMPEGNEEISYEHSPPAGF